MAGAIFWAQVFFGVVLAAVAFLSVDERLERYHEREANEVAYQVGLARDEASTPAQARAAVTSLLPELMRRHHLDGIRVELPSGAVEHGDVADGGRDVEVPIEVRDPHGALVTVRPSQSKASPLDERKIFLLLVGVLTLASALALRRVLQRIISQPFLSMVNTARTFLEGDHAVRFDHTRGDEFGYLARFINEALDQLEARQVELTYEASHDALTGLANRREFERQLEDALDGPPELGEPHGILFADLDEFKPINDKGGHQAGDAILREVATLLRRTVRGSDVVARMGGDEFAVLLRACPLEKARVIAEEIRTGVEALELPWEGETFRIGVSIGITNARSGDSIDEVIKAADDACYAAKRGGRNQVSVVQLHDVI